MFDFSSHERADGNVVAPTTDVTLSSAFGLLDRGRPSEREIRRQLRGTLDACLRARAKLFARSALPGKESDGFMVKRVTSDGMEEVEEDHPWTRILRQPNEYRSAYDTWYWTRMAADVQGTAPLVVRDGSLGTPDALLEIFPSFGRMRERINREGGVGGYIYHRSDGNDIPLERDDVVTIKRTDPTTPHGTMSILESLVYEAKSDRAAAEYRHKTYSEGRPPLVYMRSEQDMGPDKAQEQGERFRNEYLKPNGSVKGVPVMYGGMELDSLGIDPDSFQMLESQELDHDVIFRVTGISKAYIDQGANRAEAEQAEKMIMNTTIQPMLDKVAAQLTISLEEAFGADEGALRVVPPDVRPVDQEEQASIHQTQVETGTKTLNELRRENGDEEYDLDIADEPLILNTLVPASRAGQSRMPAGPDRDVADFL